MESLAQDPVPVKLFDQKDCFKNPQLFTPITKAGIFGSSSETITSLATQSFFHKCGQSNFLRKQD